MDFLKIPAQGEYIGSKKISIKEDPKVFRNVQQLYLSESPPPCPSVFFRVYRHL
jgi:hypothetical protein